MLHLICMWSLNSCADGELHGWMAEWSLGMARNLHHLSLLVLGYSFISYIGCVHVFFSRQPLACVFACCGAPTCSILDRHEHERICCRSIFTMDQLLNSIFRSVGSGKIIPTSGIGACSLAGALRRNEVNGVWCIFWTQFVLHVCREQDLSWCHGVTSCSFTGLWGLQKPVSGSLP